MIEWSDFATGRHRVSCPACGRNPRDRTLGVKVEANGAGVAHCFRCGLIESSRGERPCWRSELPKSRPRARQQFETLSPWGQSLWRACRPLSGPAQAYLEARSCVVPPPEGDLRWHPRLRHKPTGYEGPALVALITHAVTGEPLTLHRTWIADDGAKADVYPARMLLGQHRKKGGVARLWPDEAICEGLGVAEGIETALALAHAHQPVWAAIDAGNLAELAVLPGVGALVIAADHDSAGIAAATACAKRWAAAGRDVRIVMPQTPGQDLNDIARAAA